MRFSGRHSLPASVIAVLVLLALEAVPGAFGAAPITPVAAPPSAGGHFPSFTPDYLLLGQLSGSAVGPSQKPRSVSLPDSYQYAATYYGAKDLESAYGATSMFSGGYDGKGETIAVIDAYGDPTIYQDLAAFDRLFGLPKVNLTVVPVGAYQPSLGIVYGWDAETALDVEAAHAMAPYAHINLVIGANASNALFEAVKLVVDQKLGDVVTMSWGLGENSFGESGFSAAGFLNYPYVEYYFQKGAAEGITFFAASGDYGAFGGTTTVTSGWPASSPFVTGVGGTTLFLTPNSGMSTLYNSTSSYSGEDAWSISPQYVGSQGVSSGGGYSDLFSTPYYQSGVANSTGRASPDVAADANPYTGMVIVLEGGEYVIGGTSLASPLWAGMAAIMDQYVGRSLGALNPYLYSIYGNKTQYSQDFHQATLGFDGEYEAGPGYNLLTGIGSPDLPRLASDIKSQTGGLAIGVTVGEGKSSTAPAQYTPGEALNITADVTTPSGSRATAGSFVARVEDASGVVASVPLTLGGNGWTGKYTIQPTDPTGEWTITVSGASAGSTGHGLAEVNVGDSVAITGPIPYPFGGPVVPGARFLITATASTPSGAPVAVPSLTAHLIYEGKVVSDVQLSPAGPGSYEGYTTLSRSAPQGSYQLVVNESTVGGAFSYLYVGEGVTGVMLTPNDDAIPSATAGEQVTFLAQTKTAAGTGLFTSNVTANVYSLSGALMSSAKLSPAPNSVQFGVFNFFRYQQANYTIPKNLTQGFYKLEFLSSYRANSTAPVQRGNYTTGFYVGSGSLSYRLAVPATTYEGENVGVLAKITDPAGAPVTTGVFLATFIPSGYAYEGYLTDYYGYTSVPLVYDTALGAWEGEYQVPSALTSPNSFVGNVPALASGPWTVYVSGESPAASNAVPSSSYVDVLPYTHYPNDTLNPGDIGRAPLVGVNGSTYLLSGIGAENLTVDGINITLADSSIGSLTIVNAHVSLVGTQVSSLKATGSTLELLHGTDVGALSLTSTSLTVSDSFYGQPSGASPSSSSLLLFYVAVALAVLALVVAVMAYAKKGGWDRRIPAFPPQV